MSRSEGACTNLAFAAMGLTESLAATGTINRVVTTDDLPTGTTRGRIGLADSPVARHACG
jgi:hypothetical protein